MSSRCIISIGFVVVAAACGEVPSVPLDATPIDVLVDPRPLLTAEASGTGDGTITSAPAGIDCGADCTERYEPGTAVTLTATAATGSTFNGWSGGGCVGTGPCVVTVDDDLTVTAPFTLQQFTLAVMKTGRGMGTVRSAPTGIDCGLDCSQAYAFGTSVTLTATPATGSVFAGWDGGGCTGTGTCVVSVMAATTVTASFAIPCDRFSGPNTTTIPNWTERAGDWAIEAGRALETTPGSFYSHVMTMDDSAQTDGCGRVTAIHNGTPVLVSAGVVLRWSAPANFIVALVQDNSSVGSFDTAWIYEMPGGSDIGGSVTNGAFGRSPNLEACVTGTAVTLRIDANQDGVYETTKTGTTTITGAGLTGVMALSTGTNPFLDDFCWGQ